MTERASDWDVKSFVTSAPSLYIWDHKVELGDQVNIIYETSHQNVRVTCHQCTESLYLGPQS
jgi:uncharacterized protein involved in tolerance to divalent cations